MSTRLPIPPAELRVLALETSTSLGGLALLVGDEVRAQVVTRMVGSHSRRLLTEVDRILAEEGLTPADLHLLVASLGPGSFTGLRIGLATLKGLALAAGVPVVGVSSLTTLACQALARDGLVAPTLDARKAEVYGALFRAEGGELRGVLAEDVVPPARWAARVQQAAGGQPVLWLGSGARLYQEQLLPAGGTGSRLLGPAFDAPAPVLLASLGRDRFLAQGADPLARLEPNYLRPSEPELKARELAAAAAGTPPPAP